MPNRLTEILDQLRAELTRREMRAALHLDPDSHDGDACLTLLDSLGGKRNHHMTALSGVNNGRPIVIECSELYGRPLALHAQWSRPVTTADLEGGEGGESDG